jgi:hypothetical protein
VLESLPEPVGNATGAGLSAALGAFYVVTFGRYHPDDLRFGLVLCAPSLAMTIGLLIAPRVPRHR